MHLKELLDSFKGLDWRSPLHEYTALYSFVALKRPLKIFELGSGRGLSSIVMAEALGDWEIPGHIWTSEWQYVHFHETVENVARYMCGHLVTPLFGNGRELAPKFAPYDLAFIDGDHSYEAVKGDFEALEPFTRDFIFHDSDWDSTPGVRQFINEARTLGKFDIINLKSAVYDIGSVGIAVFQRLKK